MDTELLAARMKSARKLRGKTLEEVAASVGMNKSTIQRYEKGLIQTPKAPILRDIAKYLNVSYDWLAGGDAPIEPSAGDERERYLEMLETRPELRALLKSVDTAKPEEIAAVMEFFRAMRSNGE